MDMALKMGWQFAEPFFSLRRRPAYIKGYQLRNLQQAAGSHKAVTLFCA